MMFAFAVVLAGLQVKMPAEALPAGAVLRLGARPNVFWELSGPSVVAPDRSRFVAEAAGGGLAEYDFVTGRKLGIGYSAVDPICYSPDGSRLAAYGPGDRVRDVLFFDARSGREVGRLPGKDYSGDFAAFAGSGLFVRAGHEDRAFRVWDIAAGREVRAFPRPGEYLNGLAAVSPGGKYLATVEHNGGRTGSRSMRSPPGGRFSASGPPVSGIS